METDMLSRNVRGSFGLKARFLSLAAMGALATSVAFVALSPASKAEAHCDSVNGPVVRAAEQALEKGDVRLVLPYVQPQAEAEVAAVFQHANEVRKLGGEARELADRYFFETVVRLHRAGEGAPYTGLKYEADFGPALAEADKTLETGSLDGVYALLDQTVKEGVAARYHAVEEARETAAREGTVEANREKAEAELLFEKYVHGLYEAARGTAIHGEGAEPAVAEAQVSGHTH